MIERFKLSRMRSLVYIMKWQWN